MTDDSTKPRTAESWSGRLAWTGTLVVVFSCLGPVWGNWSGSVVAPFGGIDAMLQLGILEWTARHWTVPSIWFSPPVFFPVPGILGCMDSLLGQVWLVLPYRWLSGPDLAAFYNAAFLGSLLLAAAASGLLWSATGGSGKLAGVFALALVGAPYTQAQLGHLNQLPPPWVLLAAAAMVTAVRASESGSRAWPWWWGTGLALVIQAAWGWYGFAMALIAVGVLGLDHVFHAWKQEGIPARDRLIRRTGSLLLPVVMTAAAVLALAQPQLRMKEQFPGFERESQEVRLGSADWHHVFNRGVYRSGPSDWLGRGETGADRYRGRYRQVLNPGWLTLALAVWGFLRRAGIGPDRRRVGRALLLVGLAGLILSFGDSVGLPGTDRRIPLPLEWLRTVAPPFRAFRGAWRFSWLMVIAVAWWAAVGFEMLPRAAASGSRRSRLMRPAAVLVLTFLAIPAALPSMKVAFKGRPRTGDPGQPGPVLTVPAPRNEYAEDLVEALWWARALESGRPVTGGVTGWVPPPVVELRNDLRACEEGRLPFSAILEMPWMKGVKLVEIAVRPGDDRRVDFWRNTLEEIGAVRIDPWPQSGYETHRLP